MSVTFTVGQQATSTSHMSASDQQQANSHVFSKQEGAIEDDRPMEEELLECLVYHLFSHSIFRPVRKSLIRYLRQEAAVKPIRPSPLVEVITDLPSMLLYSLPLLISFWFLTSYCWLPLCGLMIWERTGSDVMHGFLSRILNGLGWVLNLVGRSYESITAINSSAVMTKGARRVLPWVDGHMDDDGALGSLLYPHCGSS